jgi:hypothetical protein
MMNDPRSGVQDEEPHGLLLLRLECRPEAAADRIDAVMPSIVEYRRQRRLGAASGGGPAIATLRVTPQAGRSPPPLYGIGPVLDNSFQDRAASLSKAVPWRPPIPRPGAADPKIAPAQVSPAVAVLQEFDEPDAGAIFAGEPSPAWAATTAAGPPAASAGPCRPAQAPRGPLTQLRADSGSDGRLHRAGYPVEVSLDFAFAESEHEVPPGVQQFGSSLLPLVDPAELSAPGQCVRASGRRARVIGAVVPEVAVDENGEPCSAEYDVDRHPLA